MSDTSPLKLSTIEQQENVARVGHRYGNIYASGNAVLHLGDTHRQDEKGRLENDAEERARQNQGLYYDTMNVRKVQLEDSSKASCDWIWTSTFSPWLKSDAGLFWICGKPGSGKSTLVNYLVLADVTRNLLPAHMQPWTLLEFYFDFRAGTGVANSQLGMLKSLLFQLIEQRPELNEVLRNKVFERSSIKTFTGSKQKFSYQMIDKEFNNVRTIKEILIDVLRAMKGGVCAFVDGLDEHHGQLGQLANSLLQIQKDTKIKLCFASRPEPILLRLLSSIPNVHMQDFNVVTIRDYIRTAWSQLDQDETMQLDDLRVEIEKEANGVILWARFVTDELFLQSVSGATMKEMREILRTYPKELEDVYERILSRLSEKQRLHAAVAFYVVQMGQKYSSRSTGFLDTEFFVTWCFLVENLDRDMVFDHHFGMEQFKNRLHAMLGGLLEFSKTLSTIRYVHKTLDSYLSSSEEINLIIRQQIIPMYGDSFLFSLYSRLFEEASRKLACDGLELVESARRQKDGHGVIEYLTSLNSNSPWVHRLSFLLTVIEQYPHLLVQEKDEEFRKRRAFFTSPLFSLHGLLKGSGCLCSVHPINEFLENWNFQHMPWHLCFLVNHGSILGFKECFHDVEHELDPGTIEHLFAYVAHSVRTDVFGKFHTALHWHSRSELVDFLSTKKQHRTSDITVWLMSTFSREPDFIQSFRDGSIQAELHELPPNLLFPHYAGNLLCHWVWLFDDCWSREASLSRFEFLKDLGFSINERAYAGGTVMHALFDRRVSYKWQHNKAAHRLWPFSKLKFEILQNAGFDFHAFPEDDNILATAKRFRDNSTIREKSSKEYSHLDYLIEQILEPIYAEPMSKKQRINTG